MRVVVEYGADSRQLGGIISKLDLVRAFSLGCRRVRALRPRRSGASQGEGRRGGQGAGVGGWQPDSLHLLLPHARRRQAEQVLFLGEVSEHGVLISHDPLRLDASLIAKIEVVDGVVRHIDLSSGRARTHRRRCAPQPATTDADKPRKSPKMRGSKGGGSSVQQKRDSECFGDASAAQYRKPDFDFQANLARFDKESVFAAYAEEEGDRTADLLVTHNRCAAHRSAPAAAPCQCRLRTRRSPDCRGRRRWGCPARCGWTSSC